MRASSLTTLITVGLMCAGLAAFAATPGSINITCDVENRAFKIASRGESQAVFQLWDAESGGSQIGADYVVPMENLLVLKVKPKTFDNVRRRSFLRIETTIGSDLDPVDLGTGEVWLDVRVGSDTLTCDYGLHRKPSEPPPARKRLHSVPFAQQGEPTDVSVLAFNSTSISVADSTDTPLTFDSEKFDTANMHAMTPNPGRLTAVVPGKYYIFGQVTFVSNPTGGRLAQIRLNGSPFQIGQVSSDALTSGADTFLNISTYHELSAGDYVELLVYQGSGGALNVPATPELSPMFGMVKVP